MIDSESKVFRIDVYGARTEYFCCKCDWKYKTMYPDSLNKKLIEDTLSKHLKMHK
jgi:hypothetical protein